MHLSIVCPVGERWGFDHVGSTTLGQSVEVKTPTLDPGDWYKSPIHTKQFILPFPVLFADPHFIFVLSIKFPTYRSNAPPPGHISPTLSIPQLGRVGHTIDRCIIMSVATKQQGQQTVCWLHVPSCYFISHYPWVVFTYRQFYVFCCFL